MKLKSFFSLILGLAAANAMAQGGYQDGVDYFNANRLEDAKTILENTLNSSSTDKAVSYFYLGCIQAVEGNQTAAQGYFEKGLAADADNPFNYVGLGEVALKGGDKKAAEKYFKEAEKFGKKDAAVYAAIGRAYFNVDPVAYAKDIKKYIDKGYKESKYTEPAIFMLEGDIMANVNPGDAAGQYETAILKAEERGDRVNPEAYVKYANTYFKINPGFAINKLKELNEKLPTSALAQRELAEKYYDNNQLTQAAEQYGKYMANPNHFQRDEQRYCGLLFFGKKYDESLKVADKVLAKDPANFYMWRMKMYNQAELGQYEDGLKTAAHFFSLTGDDFNYKDYDMYGDLLLGAKKPLEAVAAFEKALKLDPEKTSLLSKISDAYADADDYNQAAKYQQEYVDKGNTSLNDLFVLSRMYLFKGMDLPVDSPERAAACESGLAAVDAALQIDANQGSLWRTKAMLLQTAAGNKTSADGAYAYEKMIDCYLAEPDGKEKRASYLKSAYNYLGSYYIDKGDKATARGYYERYLELDPDNVELAKYLKSNF